MTPQSRPNILELPVERPDESRSATAYTEADDHTEASLRLLLEANYLKPTDLEVHDPRNAEFLREKCRIIVPMKEDKPVIHPLLSTLTDINGLDLSNLLVINDHSGPEAVKAVEAYGVQMVKRDKVLDCLDWPKLLSVLGLSKRPKGKGVAVLAGYLYQWALAQKLGKPEWIFHTDSEEAGYGEYRGLEYIAYGILQRPDAGYVKLAKAGRGNERCLAARCGLNVLAESEFVDAAIRIRAAQLFDRLVNHKWMLAGTFAMRWELAMKRPLATGYLEETLISIYCADHFAREKEGCTVQVANPHRRGDGCNDERKESAMQQQISNFLWLTALSADSTDNWGLQEIARLNNKCLHNSVLTAYIQPDDHSLRNEPCQAAVVPQDRIIPSISMLVEGGFINIHELEKLV